MKDDDSVADDDEQQGHGVTDGDVEGLREVRVVRNEDEVAHPDAAVVPESAVLEDD